MRIVLNAQYFRKFSYLYPFFICLYLYFSCLAFNTFFLGNILCFTFQFRSSTSSPSPNPLICHSRLSEFSVRFSCPSAHLQFFISRSNAFSFPDICVTPRPLLLLLFPKLSSIRLFIRFHRLIVHNHTVARESILSLCRLFICLLLVAKSFSGKRIENRNCVCMY